MENNEITISIICRKDRVNAANEAPLYLRINKGQQKKLLSLKLQIPIMYWDFENNVFLDKCVNRNYYDLVIEEKKQEINKKIMAANLEGRVLSLDEFGEKKPQKVEKEKKEYVKQHFDRYIEELEATDHIKNARYYRCCLNCLMAFTKGTDIELKSIDTVWL